MRQDERPDMCQEERPDLSASSGDLLREVGRRDDLLCQGDPAILESDFTVQVLQDL